MAYGHYSKITIDNTKVSGTGNLTDFSLLISGVYDGTAGEPDLRTDANGGNIQNTDSGGVGGNITVPADYAIYDDTDQTTQYDHEIINYVASTGEIQCRTRVPTVYGTVDTDLYQYYNDSAVTTSQENIAGTWNSNYKGVWHLEESGNGTTDEFKDSSGSTNHGTGGVGAGAGVPTQNTSSGKIHYSQTFDDDEVRIGNISTDVDGTDFTIIAWVYQTSTASVYAQIAGWHNGGTTGSLFFGLYNDDPYILYDTNTGGNTSKTYSSYPLTANTWYQLAVTKTSTTIKTFRNGSEIGSETDIDATLDTSTFAFNIGNENNGLAGLIGDIDEVRVLNTNITSDHLTTIYNNENSPSTFYTMGSEQAASAGATASVSPLALAVTMPSVTATYEVIGQASVSPLGLTVTTPAVTATYNQVSSASVSPLSLAITVPTVTATSAGLYSASVSPLALTASLPVVTADYASVWTSSVSPLGLTITVPGVTATFETVAQVSPLGLEITVPTVTATGLFAQSPYTIIFVEGNPALRITSNHYILL